MGRVFAISDIHGNADKLKSVLIESGLTDSDLNWLDNDNHLVVLGDLIDRGPDSKGVVNILDQLRSTRSVTRLLGNHEDMLINGLNGDQGWFECWLMNGGEACLSSYGLTPSEISRIHHGGMSFKDAVKMVKQAIGFDHIEFFSSLLNYVEIPIVGDNTTEIALFVHAGVHPFMDRASLTTSTDEQGARNFLWIRSFFYNQYNADFLKSKYKVDRIIFGHTPTGYITGDKVGAMLPLSKNKGRFLCIDTGSNYANGSLTLVEILPNFKHRIVVSL
jgi:serine/threonine protein phosphatase 1